MESVDILLIQEWMWSFLLGLDLLLLLCIVVFWVLEMSVGEGTGVAIRTLLILLRPMFIVTALAAFLAFASLQFDWDKNDNLILWIAVIWELALLVRGLYVVGTLSASSDDQ